MQADGLQKFYENYIRMKGGSGTKPEERSVRGISKRILGKQKWKWKRGKMNLRMCEW